MSFTELLSINYIPFISIFCLFVFSIKRLVEYKKSTSIFCLVVMFTTYIILQTRWIMLSLGEKITEFDDISWSLQESGTYILFLVIILDLLHNNINKPIPTIKK